MSWWLAAVGVWALGLVGIWRLELWRATKRRERLGTVAPPMPEADGEQVVLEGVLDARYGVWRFEDGANVAVSSVRAGETLIACVRADDLALKLGTATPVVLDGPVELALGSVERRFNARIERLPSKIRERIAEAGGEPLGDDPRFQSLASGDRVRVRGTLRVNTTGGYRESEHRYTLGGKLDAAYAGTPRLYGWLGGWNVAILFVLSVGATALGTLGRQSSRHATPSASAKPLVLTPEACSELRRRYTAALDSATPCTRDDECVAELRDRQWFSLDHCFRFVHRGASELGAANAFANQWYEGGCASDYDTCRMPPPAQCFEGHCRELPPNGLPRDWRRQRVGWLYSLFTPPDTRVTSGGEDSIVRSFEHEGFRLSADYGQWSGVGPEEDSGAKLEERLIDGRKVTIESAAKAITFWAGNVPPCPANRCGLMSFGQNRLTFYAECSTPDACQTVRRIVDTLEIYGD